MTVIFETSFEATGIESGWAQVVGTGCTLDWDSTDVARPTSGGAQTLKSVSASTGYNAVAYYDMGTGNGLTKSFTRLYEQYAAEGLANGQFKLVARMADQNNLDVWQLRLVQAAAKLYWQFVLYNNGIVNTYPSAEISADTWYRIEVKYDDTDNTWEWKIDGVSQDDGALAGTHRTEIRYFTFGAIAVAQTITLTNYTDLVKVDNADWPGPGLVLPIFTYYQLHHR